MRPIPSITLNSPRSFVSAILSWVFTVHSSSVFPHGHIFPLHVPSSMASFAYLCLLFPEVAAGSPCRRERQSNCNLKGSCAQENKFRVHQTDTDDIRKPCKAGPINVITTKNCLFISISSSALLKKMSTSVVCTGFGMLREDSDGVCCVACGPQWWAQSYMLGCGARGPHGSMEGHLGRIMRIYGVYPGALVYIHTRQRKYFLGSCMWCNFKTMPTENMCVYVYIFIYYLSIYLFICHK